jgi:hypothetical protein
MPDAGRITFAVVGSGPAIVLPAWWVSHLAEDWHFEPLRRFVEPLAGEHPGEAAAAHPCRGGREGRAHRAALTA